MQHRLARSLKQNRGVPKRGLERGQRHRTAYKRRLLVCEHAAHCRLAGASVKRRHDLPHRLSQTGTNTTLLWPSENDRTLLANLPDWLKAAPMRENLLA